MPLKEKIFWHDTVEMPAAREQPLPERVDVAVSGSGVTGLSAARALARRGARVAVLEANSLGWGASSRNGGMVLTGLKVGVGELMEKYGREATRRMFAASLASIDCVEQIVREEGIECDFVRSGHLEVASKPAHFEDFARAAEAMAREFKHPVRLVPKSELRGEIGSDAHHGGMVDEASAGLNPARYVAGLAHAAERAGALLFDNARVKGVEREGTGFCLTTARGLLRARDVLVGTSGYTGRATPNFQRKIIPIGSYIIATQVLPEALAREVSPRDRMIFDSKNFLYYFRLTPDRRMLFGGRAAFFPESPTAVRDSAEILRRGMLSVYPQLRDVEVEYVWGGTLDFAFDKMPHAGQLEGLHYALGYAGHGVALATYLGSKLGEQLAGGVGDNPFEGIRFPDAPLGLYDGRPWFLPFAWAWYKFLDWIS